ncbi:MAG: ABC transporter ATP-binding protein [Eubacteriales bacterium]|jgi:ATP-binding cassette subfamily B protein|nr:ABC transporter ATP-binding protein [Eubacteriales bacterium]
MLKRFVAYYRNHMKIFILDMLASLMISVIGLCYPILTRKMLNELIPNRQIRLLFGAGALLLLIYLIRMLLRYFVDFYGHTVGVYMQSEMRRDMFEKLETLPFSYYDDNETGKIMSRMTNDLMNVSELAHHGPETLLISGIMVIGSTVYLSTIDPLLTLIIICCVPFLVAVSIPLRKRMSAAFTESRLNIAEINSSLESSISGIRVTKAFTNEKKEEEKFAKSNSAFVSSRLKAYKAMAQFFCSTSFIIDVFNVIILVAGGAFIYYGRINAGDYATFIISVNLFIGPVSSLINFIEQFQDGVTGFKRFIEVMDEEPEKDKSGAVDIGRTEGKIEFRGVSFAYDETKGVLNNIDLTVEPGRKIALVGPSGGGKTTICHLIPRFYKVSEGTILLDGTDIDDITYRSLRQNIGIVQQDVFLFNGTIRENILYGRLDATEEEMILAAKRANIHDYVMTLVNGYETEIGERGVRLSGGQKQRLSIARFFLKDPAVLILDEATSALDNATEILIQQSLDELCSGRTTFIVAHRLSTIRSADEIAVISEGNIIERGTHEELMEAGGLYKDLYTLQFRTESHADLLA